MSYDPISRSGAYQNRLSCIHESDNHIKWIVSLIDHMQLAVHDCAISMPSTPACTQSICLSFSLSRPHNRIAISACSEYWPPLSPCSQFHLKYFIGHSFWMRRQWLEKRMPFGSLKKKNR